MHKYYIVYNNKNNLDLKLFIMKRPVKPPSILEYEEKPVPGGETLYIKKYYKDIDIPVEFNFVSTKDNWESDYRKIKEWLNSKINNELKFSDDLGVFYKVKKVQIDTPERVLKKIGRFSVSFTCSPYAYFENGKHEIEITGSIYNTEGETKPILRFVGEGLLNLNINDKIVTINVGQELILNTELGLCFRRGSTSNVSFKGAYKDLYLREGINTFSWQGNFKIYITPNWRCLN